VAEQAPGFGDGERDHPGVSGRGLVREYRCGGLGAGTAAQQGGGDGADGQGGHDQHGVPGDRGVQADLGLAEPEAVLAELEIFFAWPAQPGRADRPRRRCGLAFGQVAVVVGQLAGGQVAADQQVGVRYCA
jgi:hypothetical protein